MAQNFVIKGTISMCVPALDCVGSSIILISVFPGFTFTTFANRSIVCWLSETFLKWHLSVRGVGGLKVRILSYQHFRNVYRPKKSAMCRCRHTHIWTTESMLILFVKQNVMEKTHWMLPEDVMIYVVLLWMGGNDGMEKTATLTTITCSSHERKHLSFTRERGRGEREKVNVIATENIECAL